MILESTFKKAGASAQRYQVLQLLAAIDTLRLFDAARQSPEATNTIASAKAPRRKGQ